MFLRHDNGYTNTPTSSKKRHILEGKDESIHELDKRLPIPDDIGKVFHPTVLGQQQIAVQALTELMRYRMKTMTGKGSKSCSKPSANGGSKDSGKDDKGDGKGDKFKEDHPLPLPKCDIKQNSEFPTVFFKAQPAKPPQQPKDIPAVYDKFCKEVIKKPKDRLKWNVDYQGNLLKTMSDVDKRSPPLKADQYKDYKFNLEWTGADDDTCAKSCMDIYDNIAKGQCKFPVTPVSDLSANNETGGSAGGSMNQLACFVEAEATCHKGLLKGLFRITGPKEHCDRSKPTTPQAQTRICTEWKDAQNQKCKKRWEDIKPATVNAAAEELAKHLDHGLRKLQGMKNYTQVYGRDSKTTYMMNIGVIPGCKIYEQQEIDYPQGKKDDKSISAVQILEDNYSKCKHYTFFSPVDPAF